MTPRRSTPLCAALLAALCALAWPAGSAEPRDDRDDRDDAERARAGVREGRYVPLSSLLDWLEARYHGHVIEVELEEEADEPPTYEIEWLTPQGHVVEFEFDARSGLLLEHEGRGLDEAAR